MEPEKPKRKLTPKEEAFCIHYTTNGYNGLQAAISAGYSIKAAKEIASRLLTKANIKERIAYLKTDEDARMNGLGVTKEAIMLIHYKFATCSIASLHNTWIERKDFENLTEDQKSCIEEIETKVEYKVFNEDGKKGKRKVEYVKLKMVSRQTSLKELANLRGWNAPIKTDVTLNDLRKSTAELFPDELK